MTKEELVKRINEKEIQLGKLKARLEVLLKECDQDEYDAIMMFVEFGDREPYKAYLKAHNTMWGSDAWRKANEYRDAVDCSAKYEKQLAAEEAKEETLANMPEVLKEFRENLINRWDKYDEWKKEQIKKESDEAYKLVREKSAWDEYRQARRDIRNKWGANWEEFMYLTSAQIHKANVTAADTLVLNLLERTCDLTGKITDCAGLRIDYDNQGYSIINGLVIGEKGKARVESIGAGGYNIQRYHIRVLVKEVRG